jgi:hypothetical protein
MAGDEAPNPESVMLVVTIDGTPSMLPADPLGDDLFAATIPAVQCGQDVSFYLSANTESGTAVTHPINAPDTQFTLLVGTLESTMLLDESFADGIPGDWSASGLWHASSGGCAPAGMCQEGAVAYFGQEGNCDYDTGGTESGQLTSPAIPLAGVGGDMSLSFCTALTTENASGWDEARVLVNGVSIALLENTSGWTEYEIDLTNVSGDTLAIGFDFDTGDEQFNDYAGWHLDNVQISASTVDCTDVPACPADIDGNGEVDTDDLLALIADWGAANSPADIDGDGTVGTDDLLALISAWGPCI